MNIKPLLYQDCLLSFFDSLFVACCFAVLGLSLSFLALSCSKTSPDFLQSSKFCDFKKRKRRVLIIIAHPDDECMFFGPTILHFTQREKALVYILCLSSGNFYNKGCDRMTELWNSCETLGVATENIIIYRCDDLPDNPSVMWPTLHTSRIINQHIHSYDIDTVISFDGNGVSGHLNHFAIFNALEHLIEEMELPSNCEVYSLESINMFRKYSSFFDILLSYTLSKCCLTATAAMKAHRSQYVWFRKMYMLFSRYVIINTLKKS
ncbi:N-acetylglucosaminyl-phosphatidylinositol de-N-acetylase [Armadillidium vulgare]|nr:N-acetylglucosaminyl-phosphatidylinositol de-N-acetylase [Armadillidium vulgare]